MTGYIMDVAIKATLLLAICAALDFAVLRQRASATVRHLLWTFAVIALLIIPILVALLPAWRVPVLPARDTAVAPAMMRNQPAHNTIAPVVTNVSEPLDDDGDAGNSRATGSTSWSRLLGFIYVFVVVVLLARLFGQRLMVARIARHASRVSDAELIELTRSLSATLRVRRPVDLLWSDGPTMPLTWGVMKPRVLLPDDARDWTTSRKRSVLLHEIAHIARHDCLTQTIAAVCSACYWIHPGAWYAAKRLRVEREFACDDQALLGGSRPSDYAMDLLELARSHYTPRLTPIAVSMAAHPVEARLVALIDRTRPRRPLTRKLVATAAVFSAVFVIPLAAIRAAAASPDAVVVQSPIATVNLPTVEQTVQETFGGTFTIRRADRNEGGGAEVVHVALKAPGLNTFYLPADRFTSLTYDDFAVDSQQKQFSLKTDAGVFEFTAEVRNGRGAGTFVFKPDPAFAAALEKRGLQRPTAKQHFTIARHLLPLEFVDELSAQKYAVPTTELLTRASLTSADLNYLRALKARGYQLGTLQQLINAWNNGVTPQMIDRSNARAGRKLTIQELLDIAVNGERAEAAVTPPSVTEPKRILKKTPLSGRWVIHREDNGFFDLEVFWTDTTNWRRYFHRSAFTGDVPSSRGFRIEQDAGVFDFSGNTFTFTPNHEFPARLQTLGLREFEPLSDHDLKNLAWGGMSAAAIREFQNLGFTALTLQQVIDMAIYHATPQDLRRFRRAGYRVETVEELIDLRMGRVR